MSTARTLVAGSLLGAMAAVLLLPPNIVSNWRPWQQEDAEATFTSGHGCEDASVEWRLHLTPCRSGMFGTQSPAEDLGPELVFNLSSSLASFVNGTKQGRAAKVTLVTGEAVSALDVHEGGAILVNDRCYTIGAPTDDATRRAVDCHMQSTFAMIKPDAVARAGEVLTLVEELGSLRIAELRLQQLEPQFVREFYAEHAQRSFFEDLVSYITSGPVLAMHLVGPNAVQVWRDALGPTDSNEARQKSPESVRALFGADKQRNAAHGSDSTASARRELTLFFADGSSSGSWEPLSPNSFLVLPHVLRDKSLGTLWSSLNAHHASTPAAAQLVHLNYVDAMRYTSGSLLPRAEPTQLQLEQIQELMSGPAVAMELRPDSVDEDVDSFTSRFKDVIGPRSPMEAQKSAAKSLRANLGASDVRSAILSPWYDWPR